MNIYKVNTVTDTVLNAFKRLIPQLEPNCPIPTKTDLEKILNANNTIIFFEEEDVILGMLTIVYSKTATGNKVWIEDVIVDSTARGKGIGENLILFAINFVSKKGINKIDLTSNPERIIANRLYQKLGFHKRETNVYRLIIAE